MTILLFGEHTIDETLLTKGGWCLDAGCGKDFFFSKDMIKRGLNVIAIDPNPCINPTDIPQLKNLQYEKKALVTHNHTDTNTKMKIYRDINAASIIKTENDVLHQINEIEVSSITIRQLMKIYNIQIWDIIKMDIEGAEYSIMEELAKCNPPIALQICVEFHDFRNMNLQGGLYYNNLLKDLTKHYDVIRHKKEIKYNNWSSYWDSLFVLKKEFRA